MRVSTSSMVQVFLDFLSAIDFANVTEQAKDAKSEGKSLRHKASRARAREFEFGSYSKLIFQIEFNKVEFSAVFAQIKCPIELKSIEFKLIMSDQTCPWCVWPSCVTRATTSFPTVQQNAVISTVGVFSKWSISSQFALKIQQRMWGTKIINYMISMKRERAFLLNRTNNIQCTTKSARAYDAADQHGHLQSSRQKQSPAHLIYVYVQ